MKMTDMDKILWARIRPIITGGDSLGICKMNSCKDTLQEVIGRDVNPETQLFLVFEDDTYFEFYGQEIDFVRSLSEGDATKAIDYLGSNLTAVPNPKEQGTRVETGPNRLVRHPMYCGGILIAFGRAFLKDPDDDLLNPVLVLVEICIGK
jgi:Phospholipid methyltransferase